MRCPFDKDSDNAVWCHRRVFGLKCLSGNYFNHETGRCYPKSISEYVFIDDREDDKAVVLHIPSTEILEGKSYEECRQLGTGEGIVNLQYFYKIENFVFNNLGPGCYVVSDSASGYGEVVYMNDKGIAIKLDDSSFRKYCFGDVEGGEPTSQASVLKYQELKYNW